MSRPGCGGSGTTASTTRGRPGRRQRLGWRRCADRGSATAELALGLPVVVLLLLAGISAVAAVTTKLQCVDAAREVALAAARGEPAAAGDRLAPAGAETSVTVGADTVDVVVRAPVPLLGLRLAGITVEGTAVAAREPGSAGQLP